MNTKGFLYQYGGVFISQNKKNCFKVCLEEGVNVPNRICAEPYNQIGRRGRKEPEALAAASSKRLFVQNQPYLVSGHDRNLFDTNSLPCNGVVGSKLCISLLRKSLSPPLDTTTNNILSMADKYNFMRETFRKRLAFGKINGWDYYKITLMGYILNSYV